MPAPVTGQITPNGAATPLSSGTVIAAMWVVKAPASNVNPVYIGPAGVSASTGYQLDAGDTFEYELHVQNGQPMYQLNLSDVYGYGTGADKIVWLASL